jgi:hypothetical protein
MPQFLESYSNVGMLDRCDRFKALVKEFILDKGLLFQQQIVELTSQGLHMPRFHEELNPQKAKGAAPAWWLYLHFFMVCFYVPPTAPRYLDFGPNAGAEAPITEKDEKAAEL